MSAATDRMAEVTARIVAQIEAGASSWDMPWRAMPAAGWPTNALTGNRYTGGNVLNLAFESWERGYTSPRWATFKQWHEMGAHVRKGERGSVGFYANTRTVEREMENVETGETELVECRAPFWKHFHVFNAAQVDDDPAAESPRVFDPLERDAHAESWFGHVPADIRWGAGNPCYRPAVDQVCMPEFDAFNSASDAYATLAHEFGHWTGHTSRLAREYGKRFGDAKYAAEELVAELSAAFTCTTVGIDTVARTDHASYLGHWVRMLREDPRILFSVASKAQAATDYLASFQPAMASGQVAA